MKAQLSLNNQEVTVIIEGISISLNIDMLENSVESFITFLRAILPQEFHEQIDMEMDMAKVQKVISVIKRFKSIIHIHDNDTLETLIELTDKGAMHVESTGGRWSFDMKEYVSLLKDVSDGVYADDQDEEHQVPADDESVHAMQGQEYEVLMITSDTTYLGLRQILALKSNVPHHVVKEMNEYIINIHKEQTDAIHAVDLSMINIHLQEHGYKFKIDESTDQSMEDMANKEIEFNSHPTIRQVAEAINMRLNSRKVGVTSFKITPSEIINILEIKHDYKNLSAGTRCGSHMVSCACDHFGLEAVVNFRDKNKNV
jgi:hypothetical protein